MGTRKEFLVASSVAAVVAASAAPTMAADTNDEIPPFIFDRSGWNAIMARDVKHHHAFAASKLSEGLVLEAIDNVLNAYEQIGEKPVSATSAAVLYHGASLVLGLNDIVWNEMLYPTMDKASKSLRDDIGVLTKGAGNPYLAPTAGTYDSSITTLRKRGAVLFLCNNAMRGFASSLGNELGISHGAAYAKLTSNLVDGAMLVPAGVWAIHALQEQHFTYQQVTL